MSSIIDFIILTNAGTDTVQQYYEYFINLQRTTVVPINKIDDLFNFVDQLKNKTQFRVWVHLKAGSFSQPPYPGSSLGEQLLEKYKNLKFQFLTRKSIKQDESEIKGIKVYELMALKDIIDSVPVNTKEESLTDAVFTTEEMSQNSSQKNKYDIAILTALHDDEFENIKLAFDLKENKDFDSGTKAIFYTGFVNNGRQKKINIVAAFQSDTGMVDAATLTAIINSICKPKYFVMTGVCGGNPDKQDIKFGDIVVPKKVFYFEKGKQSEKGFEPEFESCDIDNQLIQQIETNKVKICRKIMDFDVSRANRYRSGPPISVFSDPMATSTFVMNEEGLFNELIASRDRKSAAVDMESYAVARACKLQNTKAIIIKAVMDKTMNKDDADKSLAAYNSAQFLKHLIVDVLEF